MVACEVVLGGLVGGGVYEANNDDKIIESFHKLAMHV